MLLMDIFKRRCDILCSFTNNCFGAQFTPWSESLLQLGCRGGAIPNLGYTKRAGGDSWITLLYRHDSNTPTPCLKWSRPE